MEGRDLFGRARTGTGKTLAFGIPIIDRIIQFNQKHGFVALSLLFISLIPFAICLPYSLHLLYNV